MNRLRGVHRCNHTVVKKYGKYFLKALDGDEFRK
jgi:hypothetical protein